MDEGAAVATETYLLNESTWQAARARPAPAREPRANRALGWSAGGLAIVAFLTFALAFAVAANDATSPEASREVARASR